MTTRKFLQTAAARCATALVTIPLALGLSQGIAQAAPVRQAAPGTLAYSHPLDRGDLLPEAGRGWYLRYATIGQENQTAWSTGVLFEPKTPAPVGGYRVVTYGHGAKGLPEKCQPSKTHAYNSDAEYHNISALLRRGYAVALTDYPTFNGVEPFLGAKSEGASILDIVRAARKIDTKLSRDIVIGGYSQGGQAALSAASIQPQYAPDLNDRGLFTMSAPWGQEILVPAMGPKSNIDKLGVSAAIGFVLAGFRAAEPQYAPLQDKYLTAKGKEITNNAATQCGDGGWIIGAALTQVHELFKLPISQDPVLQGKIIDYLRTPTTNIRVPVLITQGTNDAIVIKEMADALKTQLQKNGTTNITVKLYPGVDHVGIVSHNTPDIVAFVTRVLPPGTPEIQHKKK